MMDDDSVRFHVLFVCTGNLQRSPTAEKHFQNREGVWDTKSAGTDPVEGRVPITQKLVDWADLVLCMEPAQAQYLVAAFKCASNKVKVLNIADRFFFDDPQLIRELESKVVPLLNKYSASRA